MLVPFALTCHRAQEPTEDIKCVILTHPLLGNTLSKPGVVSQWSLDAPEGQGLSFFMQVADPGDKIKQVPADWDHQDRRHEALPSWGLWTRERMK